MMHQKRQLFCYLSTHRGFAHFCAMSDTVVVSFRVSMPKLQSAARIAAAIASAGAITLIYAQLLPVNPTTVALTYLLAVLIIASSWGIVEATAAALTAVLCFNFFFLPPVGTLTIADPQNWVALVVFMITAAIVSQLSGRARKRHLDAVARQNDLERLYALSRALLLTENGAVSTPIARHVADAFQLPGIAIYEQQAGIVSSAGSIEPAELEERLKEVARRGVSFPDGSDVLITAIRLGGAPIGSIAIKGGHLSDTVLQSVINLVAIALERTRGQLAATRAEAARHSSEIRAAVLDAAAHEFKTPLTAMKAAATALQSTTSPTDSRHELVEIVNQELSRLQSLVTDAIQMLRIDSGDFVVHRQHLRAADVVAAAISELRPRFDGHTVINQIPADLVVDADGDLLRLALRQLIDNAVKYSSPTSTIRLLGTTNGTVQLSIHNSHSTIPESEQARVFERFYRGSQAHRIAGTGMGLAIVQQIAEAHGGSASVSSSPQGTEFVLTFPHATTQQ